MQKLNEVVDLILVNVTSFPFLKPVVVVRRLREGNRPVDDRLPGRRRHSVDRLHPVGRLEGLHSLPRQG